MSQGNTLLKWWQRLSSLPAGRALFSIMLGQVIPYTGSIKARVQKLEPGHAVVTLRDRRRVRNHLRSIHAVALMNLAEFTTGLAMTSQLTPQHRAIITGLTMEYLKKARGPLKAECRYDLQHDGEASQRHQIVSEVHNRDGELVARGTAEWLIGPAPNVVRVADPQSTGAKY
jgi:acyl-coenzyme A thioesterase PaaI-like protein